MSGAALAADRGRFGSAADFAYAALRREILAGRFAPGRRMREIELSEQLGISRTPTRQALSRLELEGLLTLEPRIGLVVASLDDAAVTELYEMRAALEGAAAAMAARHASPRDLARLSELVAREAMLPDEPRALAEHNLELHGAIYAAAHNRFLLKSVQALHDAIALLGPTTLADPGRQALFRAEHGAIVAAIAARDPAAAEAAARGHIERALDVRRAMLARARHAPT
jgi:DNA-binding GntR family transcriptional regulator